MCIIASLCCTQKLTKHCKSTLSSNFKKSLFLIDFHPSLPLYWWASVILDLNGGKLICYWAFLALASQNLASWNPSSWSLTGGEGTCATVSPVSMQPPYVSSASCSNTRRYWKSHSMERTWKFMQEKNNWVRFSRKGEKGHFICNRIK